jgi:hypothetical protein
VGRAYLYRPNLSAEEARAQALGQVLENFFGGSKDAMIAQLRAGSPAPRVALAQGAGSGGSSVVSIDGKAAAELNVFKREDGSVS